MVLFAKFDTIQIYSIHGYLSMISYRIQVVMLYLGGLCSSINKLLWEARLAATRSRHSGTGSSPA